MLAKWLAITVARKKERKKTKTRKKE